MYSGHLWTAKWWSYGDAPGGQSPEYHRSGDSADLDIRYPGAAGDWQDDGTCTSTKLAAGQFIKSHYEEKEVPKAVPVETPSARHSRFFRL